MLKVTYIIVNLDMDIDDMNDFEELQLYTMYMQYLFIIEVVIIICAIKQQALRSRRIEHKIGQALLDTENNMTTSIV